VFSSLIFPVKGWCWHPPPPPPPGKFLIFRPILLLPLTKTAIQTNNTRIHMHTPTHTHTHTCTHGRIIVATPSMRKHVIVNIEQMTRTEMTSAPVSDDYFSSRKCDPRPPYFQRDMDSKNRRDYTSLTRSRKPS